MKKIVIISISIVLILILLICFLIIKNEENTNEVNNTIVKEDVNLNGNMDNTKPINIDQVNNISIKEDDKLKDNIDDTNLINTNSYFYKSWNKISIGEYFYEIEQLNKNHKGGINGAVNMSLTVEDENINFVGTSFASSNVYEDGFRIVTREEALKFINDNSNIQSSAQTKWYNENFKENMIYMIVSSTTFNPEFAAFPEFRYSLEEGIGYFIFKKSFEHYYVSPQIDNLKEIINEKSKATYTVIAIDSLDKFNNIKVIFPQQFEDEEEKFDAEAFFLFSDGEEYTVEEINNMQVLKNDIIDLKAVSISSSNQNPKGILIMNEENVKKFLKENSSQINDEFFGEDRIYVLLSSNKFKPGHDIQIRVAYNEPKKDVYIACESKEDIKETNDFNATYMLMSFKKEKLELLSQIKYEF